MMNERIRELLKKVNAISYNDDNEEQEPVLIGRQQVEKFAELIVRECLNNMENCDGDLDFAIWKTKKDFGIE